MPPRKNDSYSVEVLQSSTTIVGIVMGVLSYFNTVNASEGVTFLVVLVGFTSLYAAVLSLLEIRRAQRRSWRSFLSPNHSMGFMYWSIFLFAFVFLFIAYPSTSNSIADFFARLSDMFRVNP